MQDFRGRRNVQSVLAELDQMETKGVRAPVKANERTAIRSFLFLKDNFDASVKFQKFKTGLVARPQSLSRQGVAYRVSTTIVILATIEAHKARCVVTADIGAAYLNASVRGVEVLRPIIIVRERFTFHRRFGEDAIRQNGAATTATHPCDPVAFQIFKLNSSIHPCCCCCRQA